MALFLALFLNFAFASTSPNYSLPEYTHPINDAVGIISPENAQKYNSYLDQLYKSGGPQVGVLIIDSLNGTPLEEYSIKLAEKWKLGGKKEDDGVILLVVLKDHKFRIEVGQGLEGTLTDLDSHRITETMVPLFQKGENEKAVLLGVNKIIEKTSSDPELKSAAKDRSEQTPYNLFYLILGGIVLYIIISIFIRDPFWGLYLLQIFLGGGGGGSGGSSSGGGGGFSGGGSSDSW